jgi:hypothetical protein
VRCSTSSQTPPDGCRESPERHPVDRSTKVLFPPCASPLSITNGEAMSPRRRKRHSKDQASALAPIVKIHLEQIEWALTYGSDIAVFSDEPGAENHNYVRQVKDHPRPKTLRIGPVSIQEVDELSAFIRGSIDFPGNPAGERQSLACLECSYSIERTVSVGPHSDADC